MTMPELKESRRVMKEHGNSAPVRKLLLAAILSTGILAAASEPAFPASITFSTALPVTQGEGIVRVQLKYFDFGDDSTPLDRDLAVWAVPVVGVWGVTRKVALFGIVPILDKELEVTTPLGRRTRAASATADRQEPRAFDVERIAVRLKPAPALPVVELKMPFGA